MPSLSALTAGAISSARELRSLRAKYPQLNNGDLADLLQTRDTAFESMPLAFALELESGIAREIGFDDIAAASRALLRAFIVEDPPAWISSVVAGRSHVVSLLQPNERQVFQLAGLLDSPPTHEALVWWDDLARFYRGRVDERKMDQARSAEERSFFLESEKVGEFAPELEVEWVSIDDNSRGYDIASFELVHGIARPKFIEVKSSSRTPQTFFLSRNEWLTARELDDQYVIHLWDASSWTLTEFSATELASDIPRDTGRARWQQVEIEWP